MLLSDMSPPLFLSCIWVLRTSAGVLLCFFSPLLFSKRLVLVFSLHSFPSISFVFCFLFFGRRSGAGGRSTCFISDAFIVTIIQRMLMFFFPADLVPIGFYVKPIFLALFSSCLRFLVYVTRKRSSIIAVRGKRIYAYLNDRDPFVSFVASLLSR